MNPDETTKLRVLNVGAGIRYLHPHGHHPTLTDVDGREVPKAAQISRDTFDVGPGQRVDLALQTGSDGVHAAGPGVWLMHDHTQPAASNKGINPGGDHTVIVYKDFLGEDGLPIDTLGGHSAHSVYFNPEYYQGKIPVFDPKIFGTTMGNYEKGWPDTPPAGGTFDYPRREALAALPRQDLIDAERHRPVADVVRGSAARERATSWSRLDASTRTKEKSSRSSRANCTSSAARRSRSSSKTTTRCATTS